VADKGNGVVGESDATGYAATYGRNDNGYGIYGQSSAAAYSGAYGKSTNGAGVFGETASTSKAGVHGKTTSTGASAIGVLGEATAGSGVNGKATSGTGALGTSTSGIGVYGVSSSSNGVYGDSASGDGVTGRNTSRSNAGVLGAPNAGVWATKGSYVADYAGYFEGKVHVNGALSKSSGSFKIDHPLDPTNRYLYHSFVESPDMMNVYNGNVVTDAEGRAVVELPAYFEALNRDFRYQLTVMGRFAQAIVEQKVEQNRFVIRTNLANVEVSWQVTGIRRDPWAERNRIQVEVDKTPEEQGYYLNPEVHDQPAELGIDRVMRKQQQ
jgi:hypothetical protein